MESQQMCLKARFMGPTWGPSGADRTQVGPMLAPCTLLFGVPYSGNHAKTCMLNSDSCISVWLFSILIQASIIISTRRYYHISTGRLVWHITSSLQLTNHTYIYVYIRLIILHFDSGFDHHFNKTLLPYFDWQTCLAYNKFPAIDKSHIYMCISVWLFSILIQASIIISTRRYYHISTGRLVWHITSSLQLTNHTYIWRFVMVYPISGTNTEVNPCSFLTDTCTE